MKPYINITPGDTIQQELDARNWSPEDLANKTELSLETIFLLLSGMKPITFEIATNLTIFGQSVVFWLKQQMIYESYKSLPTRMDWKCNFSDKERFIIAEHYQKGRIEETGIYNIVKCLVDMLENAEIIINQHLYQKEEK